ncbi:MAG: CHRD domain-containing protein [Verrucomicrobiota bacterium]
MRKEARIEVPTHLRFCSCQCEKRTIKTLLSLCVLLGTSLIATAQGTFIFGLELIGRNVIPPNDDPRGGHGTATLTGDELFIHVIFDEVWPVNLTRAFVRGPAEPGSTAPILFDLGEPQWEVPNPPNLGAVFYATRINLISAKQEHLLAGKWYMEVTTIDYPEGHVRGQFVLIPEPSTFALFCWPVLLFCISRWRNPR